MGIRRKNLLSALGYFLLAALIPAAFPVPRLRLAALLIALYAAISVSGRGVEWCWLRILGAAAARGLKRANLAAYLLVIAFFLGAAAWSVVAVRFSHGRLVLMILLLAIVSGSVVATMGAWLYQSWSHLRLALVAEEGK